MGSVRHGKRITVPQRSIGGGMAFKFETDPYDVQLHGLLSPEQFTEAMENLNRKLRPSRPGAIDSALLVTGPLLVPLAVWGVRHRGQTKKRKRLLKEGIHEFNMQYQELQMRWNRRSSGSMLIIEERHQYDNMEQPGHRFSTNHGRDQGMQMVEATLIADSGTSRSPQVPPQGHGQPQLRHPIQSQQMLMSSAPHVVERQHGQTMSSDGLV